jgi:hypothetical protein
MSIDNPNRQITRTEALMWLNDRLGRRARVYVEVDVGDYSVDAVSVETGTLQHWRENAPNPDWAGRAREDIAGLYEIGPASIDLTELDCDMWLTPRSRERVAEAVEAGFGKPGEMLIISLDENVQMRVVVFAKDER